MKATKYAGGWTVLVNQDTLDVTFRMSVGDGQYSLIIPNNMTVVEAFALLINNAGGSDD